MEKKITITPDMEIMRGTTILRELCSIQYIVFLMDGVFYIAGDNPGWQT